MSSYKCRRCSRKVELDEDGIDEETGEHLAASSAPDDRICEGCHYQISKPVPPLDIEATFGPGGPLAGGNPNYEARPGQVRLSRAIFDAAAGGGHLLAEGPCGIGKSKAYGVPASYLASHGKRVLIVTASIALQEQLIKKDLPDLASELPWKFTFAMMKGKSNFLCREELRGNSADGLSGTDADAFREIAQWSKKTETGDKSELLIKPSDLVWSRFSTSSDACPGKKCGSYRECFARKARAEAEQAGVIVTNYHLFFLNMAYGGTILPAADVVILDEAHEAADIARDLLGFKIGEYSFGKFARDAMKRGLVGVASQLRDAARNFFDQLLRFAQSPYYKSLVRWPIPVETEELEKAVLEYQVACAQSHLVDHAATTMGRLKSGVEVSEPNCVYWVDVSNGPRGERAALQAKYVEVGGILNEQLWGAYRSVVAVSATLTADKKFDFVRRELGAPSPPECKELVVESPFAFCEQAMLVLPLARELPEPNDPAFVEVAARRTIEVIEACGGRTLALFTSYRALNAIYDRVTRHFAGRGIRFLRQGDAPPNRLTQMFKEDARSVLFGTSSFWTGIDVPGEALTGLVIDKIPFASPDDPVTIRMTEADPRGSFNKFTVPKAILTLRQGVGRLIRSQRDVGAVVILDKRISTKSYGRRFESSLPAMRKVVSTSAIAPFLRSKGVAA